MTGWFINGAVSPGSGASIASVVNKASGFIRLALMRWLLVGVLLGLCLTLFGCAGSLVKPEGAAQMSVYAQKLADGAEAASTQLLDERLIHSSVARKIADNAVTLRTAATLSRKVLAGGGDEGSALAILKGADEALKMIETFMVDHNRPLPAH